MCDLRDKIKALRVVPKYNSSASNWSVFIDGKRYPRNPKEFYQAGSGAKSEVIDQAMTDRLHTLKYGNKRSGFRNWY